LLLVIVGPEYSFDIAGVRRDFDLVTAEAKASAHPRAGVQG
jgi:hypothetical protein